MAEMKAETCQQTEVGQRVSKTPAPWHSFRRKEMQMSTLTAPRPAVKPRRRPQRFARLDDKPTANEPALLTLHVAGKETDYWLYLQPSDFGEAFRLEKIIPTEDGP